MSDVKSPKADGIVGSANNEFPAFECTGVALHHHEVLLKMAESALDRKESALAIILAHAACEIFTERTFKLVFSFKKVECLYNYVIDPVWEYNNLKAKKARDLYMVMTGDNITKDTKFWKGFLNHVDRRNRIAHKGETATRLEAEESCRIVKEFIRHVDQILQEIQPPDWGE